jgi:hypothetical protein
MLESACSKGLLTVASDVAGCCPLHATFCELAVDVGGIGATEIAKPPTGQGKVDVTDLFARARNF